MILNSEEIKSLNIIESFNGEKFGNASYDLSIDKIITMDGKEQESGYKIDSQEMIWVICKEKFNMPKGVIGFAHIKTALTREGIFAMNMGIIDPGYIGKISTLLINFGEKEKSIFKNEVALRVTFAKVNEQYDTLRTLPIEDDDTYLKTIRKSTDRFHTTFLNMKIVDKRLYGFLRKTLVYILSILAAIAGILGVLLMILELIKKHLKKMIDWNDLSKKAWAARENAYTQEGTKVGASILSESNKIYSGCNIEHIFRSHDIHAEVNAISNMVGSGDKLIKKILIVAERDFFTPCGSCTDWIMQFADDNTLVGFQGLRDGAIQSFKAKELMPYYPK